MDTLLGLGQDLDVCRRVLAARIVASTQHELTTRQLVLNDTRALVLA